jgi:hypothetical protein
MSAQEDSGGVSLSLSLSLSLFLSLPAGDKRLAGLEHLHPSPHLNAKVYIYSLY